VTRRYGGTGPFLARPPRQLLLLEVLTHIADQKRRGLDPMIAPMRYGSIGPASVDVRQDASLVLIVDDSELDRLVAERMLTRLGYQA